MIVTDEDAPIATALHEACHIIADDRERQKVKAGAAPTTDNFGPVEAVTSTCEGKVSPVVVSYLNLYIHDADFVRILLHVRRRAALVGLDAAALPDFGFVDEVRGCITSVFRYDLLLSEETKAMRKASFAEIRRTPYPAPFVAEWNRGITAVVSALGGRHLASDLFLS